MKKKNKAYPNLIILIIILQTLGIMIYCSSFCLYRDESYKIKYPSNFGYRIQEKNDTLKKAIVTLGRFLFYDKRLSGSNTISCGTCHIQKMAFSDNKKFSMGETGNTTRNSMSLTNLIWQDKFFWDGRTRTLQEQALIPIQNKTEMNQPIDSLILELENIPMYQKLFRRAYGNDEISAEKIGHAIAQFEKIIVSADSKFDRFLSGDSNSLNSVERRGMNLFTTAPNPKKGIRGAGCSSCHTAPLFMNSSYQNNGLDSVFRDRGLGAITKNPHENGKFKIPGLRNISLTAPYMHDGRFSTLKEVLQHYTSHVKYTPTLAASLRSSNTLNGKKLDLTEEETESLIAFLKALTDENILKNKEYSNPFRE